MSTTVLALLFLVGLVAAQPGRRPKGPIPGGLTPADDVNDATIQSMSRTAVQKLGSAYSLTRVISASTQVVAGTLYHLELAVSKTTSSTPPTVNNYTCKVKVHEQPWMSYLEMTEFCCKLSN
ncbi:uncharacterized protein LOC127861171 [Dreissena polymorpha]|uniref:Cystatin domain-containing protein n=1 Tax=Dreissena polymorpha TaxID=45954 RepID=A0A9D4NFW8_DREPO|nr:uncharacterized protein LOC127861171 [Dreissena polymorpha]KAH3893916.1 hypothetical protein DPMN_018068 [Dreissena polymorpha]